MHVANADNKVEYETLMCIWGIITSRDGERTTEPHPPPHNPDSITPLYHKLCRSVSAAIGLYMPSG